MKTGFQICSVKCANERNKLKIVVYASTIIFIAFSRKFAFHSIVEHQRMNRLPL